MKKILLSMFLLGTLLSANAQVPSYVPTNGLVGWWPFNGNANDESGNGNNGSVNGTTLAFDRFGKSNSAYAFDGVSNYIDVPTSSTIENYPNGQTISFWFTISSYPNDGKEHYIISKTSSNGQGSSYFQIFLSNYTSVNTLNYRYGVSANQSSQGSNIPFAQIQLNTWYNICFTTDLTTTKTYLNGVLFMTYNQYSSIGSNSANLSFGKPWSTSSSYNYFNGQMDDIGLWNRALDSSEISKLYTGCVLSITNEPTNQSVNINSQAQFAALASDTTVSYQWQSNSSSMGWANVPSNSVYTGVTSKKLTVNNIQVNNHKQLFRVIATKNTCKDTSVIAMLTVNDTCITRTTDTLYIKVNTSSLSNPIYNTVKVYPNPSSTQVIIDNGNYSTMGSYTAKIVNSIGQQVFQSVINQQQFVIDAKTMGGAGVYTLYITDSNNKVVGVKKIVLQ